MIKNKTKQSHCLNLNEDSEDCSETIKKPSKKQKDRKFEEKLKNINKLINDRKELKKKRNFNIKT